MIRSVEERAKVIVDAHPLGSMQKNLLWEGCRGEKPGTNIEQVIARLREPLQCAAFEATWRLVVDRHPILRGAILEKGEQMLEIHESALVCFEHLDWSKLPPAEQESKFHDWLATDRRLGFAFDQPPLCRWTLIRLAESDFQFVWTFHHLLLDAHAFALVLKEVFTAYEAFCAGHEPQFDAPKPYRDFVKWEKAQDFSKSRSFWQNLLAGFDEPAQVQLPTPAHLPGDNENSHGEFILKLGSQTTTSLQSIATANGFTLSTLLHAGWALLLSYYSGKDDIVFGSVRGGRHSACPGADKIVGLLINTVPVRIKLNLDQPVREWLAEIREQQIAAREHERTPLANILEWSNAAAAETGLLQSIVSFQNPAWHEALRALGGAWLNREFRVINQPNVPLWLDAYQDGSELVLQIGYSRTHFEDAAIGRLVQHLRTIFESLAQKSDQRLGDISPYNASELRQVLVEWNDTAAPLPSGKTVHELFEAQAAATPDAWAVASDVQQLTYRELNEKATRLAAQLKTVGVQNSIVGVCLERSAEFVVAALAVLKAGAAYAPLDPAYPAERLAYIVSDARMPLVLTTSKWRTALNGSNTRVVCLDEPKIDLPAVGPEIRSKTPSELAYVIYTSGSTGRPKGVAITHRSLLNLVQWHQREYQITARDRATLIASPAFDASVWELWPYLVSGASVHIPDDTTRVSSAKLTRWFCEKRITVSFVPTPLAESLLDETWPAKPALRALLTGGDRLHRPPPLQFPCRVVNHYGPTESTVVTTSMPVEPSSDNAAPSIGRPIANTQVYLLDAHLRPVPVGVPGELHIGGEGLAVGYLNHPELTAEHFIANPFTEAPGVRLYKTGDLARYRADGQIEFIGRKGQQVKIRGCRIELGEIESVVAQHPDVKEAAVVVRADSGEDQLIAFVVKRGDAGTSGDELRVFLKSKLPEYMLPAAFVFIDASPITANGKVDRRALASQPIALETDRAVDPPRNQTEAELVRIWSEVLGRKSIGIHDNFFDLGGHSLAAARVISRLAQTDAHSLDLHDIFSSPTVANLAEKFAKQEVASQPAPSSVNASAEQLSFAQERLWFLEQLSPGVPFSNIPVAFRIQGAIDAIALERSLDEIVSRHPVFQSAFSNRNGQPRVTRENTSPFKLQQQDFSRLPLAERAEQAARYVNRETATPFDLTRPPLLRASLVKMGPDEYQFLLVTHHIVCDGWSMDILYRDLSKFYESFHRNETPAPAEPFNYAAFSSEQRQTMSEGASQQLLAFWKDRLANIPTALELPTDHPRPPIQTYRGATLGVELPEALTHEIESLARKENATPFMVLLAAFQTLMQRYSGQEKMLVGSPVAGRSRADTEDAIGLFLNTVVLPGDLSADPTFRELLGRTRGTVLDALAHQNTPFELLAETLQSERDLSRSPLFQVMFVLQNEPLRPLTLPGLEVTPLDVHTGTAKFDLTLSLQQEPAGLRGQLEYNTALFEPSTAARMLGHYRRLLEAIISNPDQRISQLPLMTEVERHQVLEEWNDTRMDFPAERCIHQLFEEQVTRTPDAIAAVCNDSELSYHELNERAERVAIALRAIGIGTEVRVGICAERSLDMLIGLLGIFKAGAAYVPLDPSYPKERLAFMLKDSDAAVLLTTADLQSDLARTLPNLKCLRIDRLHADFVVNGKHHPPSHSSNLAYLMYTSGSTGKPKGVMVTHRNVVNFFAAMDRVLGTEPGVWLAVTSISFDISILELFWTLTRGFKVVIDRPDSKKIRTTKRATPKRRPIDFSLFYFGSDADERQDSKYRLMIEGAKFADANGFTAVWTPERHFHRVGGLFPNPSVISAALAMNTRRLQIRAGSVVVPLHHPVRLAEEWAVVDNLSNGRAAISFASGWHANDFAFSPDNYSRRKEITVEGIETIRRLWRGEKISFINGSGKPIEIQIYPKPIQAELPAWLTSSGNVQTFETAAEHGLNVLTHLLGQGTAVLANKIEAYRRRWRKKAHAHDGKISLMLHTFLWTDRQTAWSYVREPLREYLRTYRDLSRNTSSENAGDAEKNSDIEVLLDQAAEGYFQTGGLFGTPEETAQLVENLRNAGVDELACLIDFGIDTETVLASLQHLNRLRELVNSDQSKFTEPSADNQPNRSIAEQIVRHGVTHLQCTPSLARALMMSPKDNAALTSLKALLVGGEPLPSSLAKELRGVVKGDFLNMYGPTESTIWSTVHRIDSVGDVVPIGRPIANTQTYIVDRNLQPVPAGIAGELLIGGEGIARGYWNRPELTAERFVPNPFSNVSGARLYRTGDRALYQPDGTIQFLGRLDHQIKLRGHRIELGEIESALRQHPAVRECVVNTFEPTPGDTRLAAYFITSDAAPSDTELHQFLERKLPDYMIPAVFMKLKEFPLTPNGKISRNALPKPDAARPKLETVYAAPRSETERQIAALWQRLLGVEKVGLHDNFFDLGGHSLLVVQAQAALRDIFQTEIPVVRLFQYPTVAAIADFLSHGQSKPSIRSARARGQRQRATFQQNQPAMLVS